MKHAATSLQRKLIVLFRVIICFSESNTRPKRKVFGQNTELINTSRIDGTYSY